MIRSSGGDFDWRQDIMLADGRLIPNNSFWNQLDDSSYANGAPATRLNSSSFDERGLGVMLDIDVFRKTNLILGLRYDRSQAQAADAPPFDGSYGVSPDPLLPPCTAPGAGCPGRYNPPYPITNATSGSDGGKSWSVSISHELPWGLRPYATFAHSSLMLDQANNILASSIIPGGFIGSAELKEAGVKASFFHNKLVVTSAAYDQTRKDVSSPSDPGATANVSSTQIRGVETEIKLAPMRGLYVSGYAVFQTGKYTVDVPPGTFADVSARNLGFQDVVDPATGQVIYPAEAFTFGGRPQVVVPTAATQFSDRTGDPETQLGLNATWSLPNGFGVYVGGNHFSAVWADRIKTIRLPAANTMDAALTFDKSNWHVKLSGYNVFNERYYRASVFDTNGKLISVMPTARWEFMFKKDFR
jgi:outer membrane receptor protein involved in Fe transport